MDYEKKHYKQILFFLTSIILFLPAACNEAVNPLTCPYEHGLHDDAGSEWW